MRYVKTCSVTILALLLLSGFACLLVAPGPVGEARADEGDGRGYVCMTFDDCTPNQYHVAYKVLHAAGINATLFQPSDYVGQPYSLTAAQLLEMQAGGWEIGSHGKTHNDLTSMTLEAATADIQNSKTELEALGLDIDTFAYPGGNDNLTLRAVAQNNYTLQRDTGANIQFLKHFTPSVRMVSALEPTSFASAQDAIDQAIRSDSVAVFYFHDLAADGTFAVGNFRVQDLAAYIQTKIASDGLRVVKFRDLPSIGNEDVFEWVATGPGVASDGANWDKGVAPTAGKHLLFTYRSVENCTLDASVNYGDVQVMEDYTGTIMQGNVNIGTMDVNLNNGLWTAPGGSYTHTLEGAMYKHAGTITVRKINLIVNGAENTLSIKDSDLKSIVFRGDTELRTGLFAGSITVDPGATVTLRHTNVKMYWSVSSSFNNNGHINGDGRVIIYPWGTSLPANLGNMSCNLEMIQQNGGSSTQITMNASATIGGYVLIQSLHSSYTMTLDTAGFDLSVGGAVTIGTRGSILWGEGTHHIGGNLDTSVGASNFETSTIIMEGSGKTVKLAAGQTFYDLNITSGASVTMLSDVTVTHAFSLLGTINKNGYTLTLPDGYDNEIISTPADTVVEDAAYSYTPQSNHAGVFAVTTDADWLTWDGTTLSGTPGRYDVGTYSVSILFRNGVGQVFQNYTLEVEARAISSVPVTVGHVGEAYQYQVVSRYPALAYTIAGPSWLTIDEHGLVTGTPPNGTVGRYAVTVTVETAHQTAVQTYTLEVKGAPITAENMNDTLVPIAVGVLVLAVLLASMAAMLGKVNLLLPRRPRP